MSKSHHPNKLCWAVSLCAVSVRLPTVCCLSDSVAHRSRVVENNARARGARKDERSFHRSRNTVAQTIIFGPSKCKRTLFSNAMLKRGSIREETSLWKCSGQEERATQLMGRDPCKWTLIRWSVWCCLHERTPRQHEHCQSCNITCNSSHLFLVRVAFGHILAIHLGEVVHYGRPPSVPGASLVSVTW